ncbi:MAG: quinate 5-dehydrogenase [Clostridiales bacterium]|nr:quinate 5-dehydrogenase [Clostridiales bacterium]
MKKVVSISLGSSSRNHAVETEILGQPFSLERIGTNGDIKKAKEMIKSLDGDADAIGLGGTDLYIHSLKRRYNFREGKALRKCAPNTPVTDGSYLKNTLENRLIYYVRDQLGQKLEGEKVLLVCGVDRLGMARAFDDCGADLLCGDFFFTMGLPIPLRSLKALTRAATLLCPILVLLPLKMLYPTGKKQTYAKPKSKNSRYFAGIKYVAGDYLFIKKNMPEDMKGKIVITNTVTPSDLEELERRGAEMLITATPEMNGRSFGTNVIEGAIAALAGKGPDQMSKEELDAWLDKVDFKPRVVRFPQI